MLWRFRKGAQAEAGGNLRHAFSQSAAAAGALQNAATPLRIAPLCASAHAIAKLRPTCWSQRRKPVGTEPVAKPPFPSAVSEKACGANPKNLCRLRRFSERHPEMGLTFGRRNLAPLRLGEWRVARALLFSHRLPRRSSGGWNSKTQRLEDRKSRTCLSSSLRAFEFKNLGAHTASDP